MNTVNEALLYIFFTPLPIPIIAFYQYWNVPWRSKRLAAVQVAANLLVKLWAVGLLLRAGRSPRVLEFCFSLLSLLIYFVMVRTSRFKLLFTYVLVLDYLVVVRGVASFLAIRLFSAGAQSWESSLISLLLYLLTIPLVLRPFRRAAWRAHQTNTPALWRTIWLAPALTSAVVLIFTNAFDADTAGNWPFLLARLSLLICVIAVFLLLLQALDHLQRQAVLEEQARQNGYILSLQRSQYAHLQSYMEEIRRARHDLRQHHNVIQSYLDSGDVERLRDYLAAQDAALPQDALQRYCQNYAVNLLLNHYAGRLTAAGVDFSFQADLPERPSVPEPDLCVVVGNLLENALEACAGQEEPYLHAVIRRSGSRALTILVDNTAPTPPLRREDGALCSTNHAGDGIGTQSIRYIAERYRGTADFQWKEGMFLASVFLNPQREEATDRPQSP